MLIGLATLARLETSVPLDIDAHHPRQLRIQLGVLGITIRQGPEWVIRHQHVPLAPQSVHLSIAPTLARIVAGASLSMRLSSVIQSSNPTGVDRTHVRATTGLDDRVECRHILVAGVRVAHEETHQVIDGQDPPRRLVLRRNDATLEELLQPGHVGVTLPLVFKGQVDGLFPTHPLV